MALEHMLVHVWIKENSMYKETLTWLGYAVAIYAVPIGIFWLTR
jgi:hypothetical protein